MEALRGRIDVAFECVGGDANAATLDQAIECLRPGGTAVLFGPSEKSVLFNTREMIGKGLSFVGANRSFVRHFQQVLDQMRKPEVQRQLELVLAPAQHAVRSAEDLNRALYEAWTKRQPGKTSMAWAGPE
jgi:ribitol-5-phosphate 2-dehydrogenase